MPYVNVKVAGTLSIEQKEKIADGITQILHDVANKPKDAVMIFIEEVDRDNIAKSGKLLSKS